MAAATVEVMRRAIYSKHNSFSLVSRSSAMCSRCSIASLGPRCILIFTPNKGRYSISKGERMTVRATSSCGTCNCRGNLARAVRSADPTECKLNEWWGERAQKWQPRIHPIRQEFSALPSAVGNLVSLPGPNGSTSDLAAKACLNYRENTLLTEENLGEFSERRAASDWPERRLKSRLFVLRAHSG
jgi:hypothetical protein